MASWCPTAELSWMRPHPLPRSLLYFLGMALGQSHWQRQRWLVPPGRCSAVPFVISNTHLFLSAVWALRATEQMGFIGSPPDHRGPRATDKGPFEVGGEEGGKSKQDALYVF